jgi:hypothetical protein
MLDSGKVAVELLPTDGIANLIKQFRVIFGRLQATVTSSVDMSHVEDWNCAFDMVDNLEDLFDGAPEFLLTRRLDSHKGRLRLVHPREGGVFLLFLFVSPY